MSDIIIIVLSSTLLASIFSSAISYIINKKNISLQYITNERQRWRVSMRDLAEKIYDAEIHNIGIVLVKLKVRINAYGRSDKRITSDSHIWSIIKKLENQKQDINEFRHNKEILIDYISILLKFDWERSKNEIIGSKKLIYRILLYIATVGLFIYLYFFVWLLPLSPYFFIVIYVFTGYFFITPDYDLIKYIKIHKDNKDRKYEQYLITFVILTFYAAFSLVSIYISIPKKNDIIVCEFSSILLLTLISLAINIVEGRRKLNLYGNYIDAVNDLTRSYKKTNK